MNCSSPTDMRLLTKLSREMLRTAKALAKAAEIEYRAAYKADMLRNRGWRWRVICDLGCYDRLDQWSRAMARAGRIPVGRLDNIPEDVLREISRERKQPKTDESGWFRLTPVPRGGAPRVAGGTAAIRFFVPTPRRLNGVKRLKPIFLTADELDLRDHDKPAPKRQRYGLGHISQSGIGQQRDIRPQVPGLPALAAPDRPP